MHSFPWYRCAHARVRLTDARVFLLMIATVAPAGVTGCVSGGSPAGPEAVVPEPDPPPDEGNSNDNLVDSVIDDEIPLRAIRATPLDGEGSLAWSFTVVGAPELERQTYRFSWSFGNGDRAEGDRVSYTYEGSGEYVVSVVVSDPNGTTAYAIADTVTVIAPEGPVAPERALIVLMDARLEEIDSVFTLHASARTNELEPGETVEYRWDFADGSSATGPEVSQVLVGVNPYRVDLAARTSLGRTAVHFEYFLLAEPIEPLPDTTSNGDPTGIDDPVDANQNDNTPPAPPPGALKAFPTAQGFGALARGGRGGQVIQVTTLEDYVPILPDGQGNPNPIVGSLRWACERVSGPRTIVFRVGGTIHLTERIFLAGEQGSNVTIAGQSAPGGGIQITGYPIHIGAGAHDIIIRHLRSRPGWTGPEELGVKDALTIHSENGITRNVIIDHCSLEWAMDENVGVGENTENITFQWCIIGEGSVFGQFSGPSNSLGMLISDGIPSDQFLTVHHCVFVNNGDRNPDMVQNGGLVELVNNYVCNYALVGTPIAPWEANSPRANIVGNVYLVADLDIRPIVVHSPNGREVAPGSFYVQDNLSSFTPTVTGDDWQIMRSGAGSGAASTTYRRLEAWPVAEAYRVLTDPTDQVVDRVLANAGASLPAYDPVDQRLLVEARDLTGDPGFGPSPTDHEDWPVLANGTPYPDADQDGMADDWETARGLDPSDPADGPLDDDGDGYTNLEEFLNSLTGE